MEEEKTNLARKRFRSRSGVVYGPVVIGLLVIGGLLVWPGQLPLLESSKAETTTAVAESAMVTPAASVYRAVGGVGLLEPATPTAILTSTRAATVTSVPPTSTATVAPLATATARPVATALPTMAQANDASTAKADPANPPKATNLALLPRPPAEIDLSRTHLWFSRPVVGNNVPSSAYRYGMTFGQRLVPHRAVDIANDQGTSVVSIGPGTVLYAGEDQEVVFGPQPAFYGNVVVIEMNQDWWGHKIYALYGHLESVAVIPGQTVNQGEAVGKIGSSGIALASHLHFEVRQDDPYSYDSVRNPELWYWPLSGRGVLAGRVIDTRGYFLPGTRVEVECPDGAPRYVETYWDQYTSPDDILRENFVISDLPAGTCRIWSELFGEIIEEFVKIRPGELSMVILRARS